MAALAGPSQAQLVFGAVSWCAVTQLVAGRFAAPSTHAADRIAAS